MLYEHRYQAQEARTNLQRALSPSLRDRSASFIMQDEHGRWEIVLQFSDILGPSDQGMLREVAIATSVEFRLVQNLGRLYEFPDRALSRRNRSQGLSR